MYGGSRVNVKVKLAQLLRLRAVFIHCLKFIYVRKHVKIRRQGKSTQSVLLDYSTYRPLLHISMFYPSHISPFLHTISCKVS